MTDSILTSIKKPLGLAEDDTSFDADIIMFINSAFNTLTDLGIGPGDGFAIENKDAVWADYLGTDKNLNSVQSYIYMRVRRLFDPPSTGYLLDSLDRQITETEWRLNVNRENALDPVLLRADEIEDGTLVVDGGQL